MKVNILARRFQKKSRKNFKNESVFFSKVIELIDSKKKTAKSLIIKVLSEQWPLSARKLYNALKKDYLAPFTYQAVYFALQEFVNDGVLLSINRKYYISPVWVERLNDFSGGLSEKYSKQGTMSHKELEEINFTSLNEFFNFGLENLETDFFGKSRLFYAQVKSLIPFPLTAKQTGILRDFCSMHDAVIFCQGKSLVDKATAKFLRDLGAKVYLGVPCAQPTKTCVINDSVIIIYTLYTKAEVLGFERNRGNYDIKRMDRSLFSKWMAAIQKHLKIKAIIIRNQDVKENVLYATKKLLP
jgi:hypothetical protein